jgi:hypothetical protein
MQVISHSDWLCETDFYLDVSYKKEMRNLGFSKCCRWRFKSSRMSRQHCAGLYTLHNSHSSRPTGVPYHSYIWYTNIFALLFLGYMKVKMKVLWYPINIANKLQERNGRHIVHYFEYNFVFQLAASQKQRWQSTMTGGSEFDPSSFWQGWR